MKSIRIISSAAILILLLLVSETASSQRSLDNIEGIWRGTSICQVKNSACHDERAIYHISRSAKAGFYDIQMNKMVNNVEEEMGILECSYDESKHMLTGKTIDRQQRENIWEFIIRGNQINGTLRVEGRTLFRVIQISKN